MKRLGGIASAQIALTFAILIATDAGGASLAPKALEIDRSVNTALSELYSHNEAARTLRTKAKAVLVFPDIKKGAFIGLPHDQVGNRGAIWSGHVQRNRDGNLLA